MGTSEARPPDGDDEDPDDAGAAATSVKAAEPFNGEPVGAEPVGGEPVNGAGSVNGSEPVNGAGPVDGAGPVNDAGPVNGSEPVNGAGPVNGSEPVNDAGPLNDAGPVNGNGVGGGVARGVALDDETVTGDDPDGPPPRPAPRYSRDRSLNGEFDDRTGLFEGPPGAAAAAEPPPPGAGLSFTPPEGTLTGRFGSSAFRAVPEIDHPRPPRPPRNPSPTPRDEPDPLLQDLARSTTPSTSPGTARSTTPSTSPDTARSTTPSTSPDTARSTTPGTSASTSRSTTPDASPGTSPGTARSTAPGNAPGTTPGTARSTAPSAVPSAVPSASPRTAPGPGPESLRPGPSSDPLTGSEPGSRRPATAGEAPTSATPAGEAGPVDGVGPVEGAGRVGPGQRAAGGSGRRLPSSQINGSGLARLSVHALVPAVTGALAAWLVVTALLRLFSHAFSSLALLIIGGGVLYGLVVAANRVWNTQPARLVGADLQPDEHPRIWTTTAELAQALDVAPLSRIVVDGGTSVLVSRGPERRELVIGLPLLIGLDDAELRALVARELIDERSPDDASGRLHRLGPRLERALGTLRPGAARWLLTAYLALHRVVAGPENERQARWCDEQVGPIGPLDAARHRIGTTSAAWQIMLEEYLPLSSLAARRPSLADAVERILAARLTEPDDRRGPSATTLLDGGPEGLRALEGSILVDDDPHAGWDEIVAVAARVQAELGAARLARAALTTTFTERPPEQPVSLDELLTALTRGGGTALVEPLLRPAIPADERPAEARAVLAQHLSAFVTLVMLREGLARHVLSWTGPPVTERREQALGTWRPWDLDDLITDAAAGNAEPLRDRLRETGADLARAVPPAPVSPPRVLSALADVELCGPFEARRIDLLVYDNGLLLAPAPADSPLRKLEHQVTWLRLPGAVSAADRVVRLAEQLGAEPGSLPGGWWIERPDITMGQLRERRTGTELQLRMADGAGVTIRATPMTSLRGTPVDDLGRLLPDAAG